MYHLKVKSRFTLGPNACKSTSYIKKCFKLKLSKIELSTKNSVDTYLYLPQEWSKGFQRSAIPIAVHYISKMENLWPPYLHSWGEIEIYTHWIFCRKFNFRQLLFEAFFDILGTFGSVHLQSKPTFTFQCIS